MTKQIKKNLIVVFTYKYPYEPPTEQFFHDEIRFLCNLENTNIVIVPVSSRIDKNKAYQKESLDYRVHPLARFPRRKEIFIGAFCMGSHFGDFIHDIIFTLLYSNWKDTKNTVQQYIQSVAMYKELKRNISVFEIESYEQIVFYSYWLDTTALSLCFLKEYIKRTRCKTVFLCSRAHGKGDLYFSDQIELYRPGIRTLHKWVDSIYPISESGATLLKKQGFTTVTLSRLGVKAVCDISITKEKRSNIIVSCSVIDENKRVSDIALALSRIRSIDIKWIHFGGGINEKELKSWCYEHMPPNVEWTINGFTDNRTILEYYKSELPRLFINLSKIEGIPVSIMEAFSAGIPVIATDVGGTSEIVKNGMNGFLVNQNYDIKELADLIFGFFQFSECKIQSMSESAFSTWKHNYYSDHNYALFVQSLNRMGK